VLRGHSMTGQLVPNSGRGGYGPADGGAGTGAAHFDSYRGFCFRAHNPDAEPLEDYLLARRVSRPDRRAVRPGHEGAQRHQPLQHQGGLEALVENSLDGYRRRCTPRASTHPKLRRGGCRRESASGSST
jgi:hypothetical protein